MHSDSSTMAFYQEFLMARHNFKPQEFGVDMSKDDFVDRLCNEFNGKYCGTWTIDELLLHPREALWFCDETRRSTGFLEVPDDVILRSILGRRKSPSA